MLGFKDSSKNVSTQRLLLSQLAAQPPALPNVTYQVLIWVMPTRGDLSDRELGAHRSGCGVLCRPLLDTVFPVHSAASGAGRRSRSSKRPRHDDQPLTLHPHVQRASPLSYTNCVRRLEPQRPKPDPCQTPYGLKQGPRVVVRAWPGARNH